MLQLFADIAGIALVKSQLHDENIRLDGVDRETDSKSIRRSWRR
jgi:hypothetical protein